MRYYIVGDEGLKRVSRKVISEQEPLPQFARSRMKVIQTYYERKGDRLLFDIRGTYIHFDKAGHAPRHVDLRHRSRHGVARRPHPERAR